MLACVKKGKERAVKKIFLKWGLEADVIGKVTADGFVTIRDRGKIAARIRAHSLTKAPVFDMPYARPGSLKDLSKADLSGLPCPKDHNRILLRLLSSPSISDKSWVYGQYDHMVQTNTVVLPGSDAAVIRLKGTRKAIAATTDCNSRYCLLDPYEGAGIAVAEAARNLVCAGADPAAATDCLNFGNPEKPKSFWYFKRCVEGISDACRAFRIAVVSGNVSFYNESPKAAINPTPTIGMIGIISDAKRVSSQSFKRSGDFIVLLGRTLEELGGSEYLKEVHGLVRGPAPKLDIGLEKAVQKTALEAIRRGLVNSAHDCSEGGLAVALAECCISDKENMIGAVIDGLNHKIRTDAMLFGESQSRIILSCGKGHVPILKNIAKINKTPFRIIGRTEGKRLKISAGQKEAIDLPLERLDEIWRGSLKKQLGI